MHVLSHVLMISTDTTFLTQEIGDTRARHEKYATLAGARLSVVICNRKRIDREPLPPYDSGRLAARATESGGYLDYVRAGLRLGLQLAEREKVDVIAAQDPFLTALVGLSLRRALKAPLILQDHSSFIGSRHFVLERPRNRWLRLMALYTLPRADAVRVVNKRERLACLRLGIKAPKVCVAPVGTDLQPFVRPAPQHEIAAWRERLAITAGQPVALWVGRPVAFKNIPLLLRAFGQVRAQLPAAKLVLAGDFRDTNFVGMAAAMGLGESVAFPGPVKHADLPALYQTATLYALSSNYEGLPRVLLEAGAAGLPVVSTDNNGAADMIVEGVTGLIVPIQSEDGLARAMYSLFSEPARARAMSERARQHVLSNFDEQDLMRRWVGMWGRVAAGKPPCES